MTDRLFKIIMGLLAIWMLYELVTDWWWVMVCIGGLSLIIGSFIVKTKNEDITLLIGVLMVLFSLLSTTAIWIILASIVVFKVGENQKLFNTVKEPLFKKEAEWREKEFISVRFKENKDETVKKNRRKWFNNDTFGDEIYEWEDVNITKVAGDTVVDLGNTILPKESNIVMIRKGFGDTKLLVPEEVAVSLDLSVLLGKVKIGEEELALKNETLKWRSGRYEHSSRKIKLVSNVLFGEIEVIFI